MVGRKAIRLAFAVLLVSCATAGATASDGATDNCCGVLDAWKCCPTPPMVDEANNLDLSEEKKLRIVYDFERCCSDSGPADGCTAYGVAGCCACRDECDDGDDSCVLCSTPSKPGGEDDSESLYIIENTDDFQDVFAKRGVEFYVPSGEGDRASFDRNDPVEFDYEFVANQFPGSYDFSDNPEQYDCSTCSWHRMTRLKQRILTQRSRSMVCDPSCLQGGGDAMYGVTLCNYFNAGKECRACCHEGSMVDGCMPCEGEGSCGSCKDEIISICEKDPCTAKCQDLVCCSVKWGEYSGCHESMQYEMAAIGTMISEQCSVMFDCLTMDYSKCSDNARTCSARSTTVSRRVQEVTHEHCGELSVTGAGIFDAEYTSMESFSIELIFRAIRASHFALQSVAIDACTGLDKLPFINQASADIIVARSSTGYLAWDEGTEPHPHVANAGIGCPRHMWFLQDTAGKQNHVFVTVDESQHPQFISSDWIKVGSDGKMTRTDLKLSCTKKKEQPKF